MRDEEREKTERNKEEKRVRSASEGQGGTIGTTLRYSRAGVELEGGMKKDGIDVLKDWQSGEEHAGRRL